MRLNRLTPDEVLAILVDSHRHQVQVDSEAEPGAVLTSDFTIVAWRAACNHIGWREIGG